MKPRDVMIAIVAIVVVAMVCDTYTLSKNKQPIKENYETICIGGYQYELVVNEFNEPVWCGEDAE